jgi:hypothetical protein
MLNLNSVEKGTVNIPPSTNVALIIESVPTREALAIG